MRKSLFVLVTGIFLLAVFASVNAFAKFNGNKKIIRVTIKNLTMGQIFSPPLVIVHNNNFKLFNTGDAASPELASLAEDGDVTGLMTSVENNLAVYDYVAAAGPVLPGKSVSIELKANRFFKMVSLAGMLVTTNDAFVGVNGEKIPFGMIKTVFNAKAYDAGGEYNSEDCSFIPGPPCGNGGVRDTAGAEGFIYIHSGIHGIGDLLPSVHDWRNPVAEITMEYIE